MDYIRVLREDKTLYGGNQGCFPERKIKGYGCGLIAAADVSLYLGKSSNEVTWEEYQAYLAKIRPFFFILPRLGMNGIMLSLGLNIVFLLKKIPYICYWKLLPIGKRSYRDMKKMLDAGIPVILTAGPNFPNIFGKESVPLYRKMGENSYRKVNSFRQHFVVVTAMEGEYLKISSWGSPYYMKWEEYLHYSKRKSICFFTNYMKISPIYHNSNKK